MRVVLILAFTAFLFAPVVAFAQIAQVTDGGTEFVPTEASAHSATIPSGAVDVCVDKYPHWPRAECFAASQGQVPLSLNILWVADGVAALLVTGLLLWALWAVAGLKTSEEGAHLARAIQIIVFIPMLLLVCIHAYGLSQFLAGWSYLNSFVRPALVVVGMLSAGALLGSLFGLPNRPLRLAPSVGEIARTLQVPDDVEAETARGGAVVVAGTAPAEPADGPPKAVEGGPADSQNHASGGVGSLMYSEFGDRLEQVADWLTKLLLGAGLTQLHSLWDSRAAIEGFFAEACGFQGGGEPVLGTIIACGALSAGFLLGYAAALPFLPVALQAGVKEVLSIMKSSPHSVRGTRGLVPKRVHHGGHV